MRKIIVFILSLFFYVNTFASSKYLIYSGDVNSNKIYLTFDDGYSLTNTISILDTLKKYKVPATFFIEGEFLIQNPIAVKRIAEEQILANHTMCHCDITKLTNEQLIKDLEEFEKIAYDITGKEISKYFRPPMGYINQEKEKVIHDLGYEIIMWNVKIYDYDYKDDQGIEYVVENIEKQVKNGSIILMHTLTKSNAYALPIIIEDLRAKGYVFAPITDLI